jgi:hypothetical protein
MSSESCSAPVVHLAVLGAHYHEVDIALPSAGSKTGRTIESRTQGREIKRDQLKSQSEQRKSLFFAMGSG